MGNLALSEEIALAKLLTLEVDPRKTSWAMHPALGYRHGHHDLPQVRPPVPAVAVLRQPLQPLPLKGHRGGVEEHTTVFVG